MGGTDATSGWLFSYVDFEARILARHPLRKIRQVVNEALASLDAELETLHTDFWSPLDRARTADPGEPALDTVLGSGCIDFRYAA